jgi:zinc transporter ZupT
VSAFDVFLYALVTALATGLGAIPFLFVRQMPRRWLGFSNAVAAGLMSGASIGLLREGLAYDPVRLGVGALVGVVFIVGSQRLLAVRPGLEFHKLRGADALKALMIVGVMTIHSVSEGVGVGVAFGGGEALGLFITIAIAVHNIPEGLAISLVLVPRGVHSARGRVELFRASWPSPCPLPRRVFATVRPSASLRGRRAG